MELNPNNPIVRQAHDNWHKILAMLMVKLNLKEVEFGIEDVRRIADGNVNVVLDGRKERQTGKLVLRIVDDKTAAELARKEGGRPKDC